ncbi:MAG: CDP-glycerol glycerophosphotransferase family protein [Clostridia bacterium]|nr:CDP-glycerol glycerophosphotransferase family protein [Clostridia bacterium]
MYKEIIPIFLAPNDAYAPHAGITITSLLENSSRDCFYEIHVLHTDLSQENVALLKSISYENASVKCLCITQFIEKEIKLMYTNFHFSKEMFYRILIPDVFPQYDKAIYLDSDICVLGDISELYHIDLEGNILGGVNDVMHARAKSYVSCEIGLDPNKYINSGVLLIDSKAFRDEGIKEKLFAELAVRDSLRYPDQDLINIVCGDRIKFLPRRWNYIWHYHIIRSDQYLNLAPDEMKQYLEDAGDIRILHFTSSVKPWNNTMIPLSSHYWKYVEKCVFKDKIISAYNELPRKNHTGFHFLDDRGDYFEITASFYSCENKDFSDVVACIDENEVETEFITKHTIEIDSRYYMRTFFKFKIPRSLIDGEVNVKFYSRETGLPYQKITSLSFPVDFLTQSYYRAKDVLFYAKGSELFITKYSSPKLTECKERFKLTCKQLCEKGDKYAIRARRIRRISKLAKLFIKKDIWLISDRSDSAGDNGEALFEHLRKHKIKGVKPYFVLSKSSKDYKRIKKIGPVLEPGSAKFKLFYVLSSRNISAHFEYSILTPIGCGAYLKDIIKTKNVFLQHGITKDDLSACYNRFVDDFDIFVTSSRAEYESIVENPAYGCDEKITKLVGLPRFDKLTNEAEKIIFILPTWRRACLKDISGKEIVDDFEGSSYFKFYSELFSNERLLSAVKKNGYKLCFYQHHLMRMARNLFDLPSDVFVDASNYSYNDVFKKGALMLTDYSSTQFDFAYLRKPIIYCQFDRDEFFASHTYKPGYFDYEDNGFGEVTYNLDDAVNTIIEYIDNGAQMKDAYKRRVDSFFAYNDRDNCKRVVKEILALDK